MGHGFKRFENVCHFLLNWRIFSVSQMLNANGIFSQFQLKWLFVRMVTLIMRFRLLIWSENISKNWFESHQIFINCWFCYQPETCMQNIIQCTSPTDLFRSLIMLKEMFCLVVQTLYHSWWRKSCIKNRMKALIRLAAVIRVLKA